MSTLSSSIEKGMKVFDSTDTQIGTVEDFKASDADPANPGVDQAEVHPMDREDRPGLVGAIAEAFAPEDNVPDELKERLLRDGYILLDADGLFASDRYITLDQVASISGDRVTLSVTKDDLIKVH